MDNSTTTEIVIHVDTLLDPITNDVRQVFQIINDFILCGLISFFGIISNIINMSVFIKQGFKDSINISLLGLAVADLACCFNTFWMSFFFNPLINNIDFPFDPMSFVVATGGLPHVCVTRMPAFITAFITLERCLCIAMPLKVKLVITPFRTKVIIISIFVSIIAVFSPVFFVNKLEWKYNLSRNRSILILTFTDNRAFVESVIFSIHSVFLSTVLLLCVIICTIILVVKLNNKTKWRETTVAQAASKSETFSVKEKKVVKMIILISAIFIACNFPTTVTVIAMVFFPNFSAGGSYENMLFVLWSFLFVFDTVNSSVNIFVYFNMSTKYRTTLREIFSRFSKTGNDSVQVEIHSLRK